MTVIAFEQGDITSVRADAIVNAANRALAGGSGVDGAIHRVGGPAIMADLHRRYGRDRVCPTGSAVVSAAGDLPARIVIHAVGPVWRGGTQDEPALLAGAYRSALDLAAEHGSRSIAFPSISTGAYGYPIDAAARVAIDTVRAWIAERPDALDRVTFVLYSDGARAAFEAASRS